MTEKRVTVAHDCDTFSCVLMKATIVSPDKSRNRTSALDRISLVQREGVYQELVFPNEKGHRLQEASPANDWGFGACALKHVLSFALFRSKCKRR